MLYSKCENAWLRLYLPINNSVVFIGYGRVALSGIFTDSEFLGRGSNRSGGAATCNQDLHASKSYLKAVDVVNYQTLGPHLVLLDKVVAMNRCRALFKLVYPFSEKDPMFVKKFGSASNDILVYNIIDKVNKRANETTRVSELFRYGMVWDCRCTGVGGPKDPGMSDRALELLDQVVKDYPKLNDCSLLRKQSLTSKSKWTEADKYFDANVRRRPENWRIMFQWSSLPVPSFIMSGKPFHTNFVTWKRKSCWYGLWEQLYGSDDMEMTSSSEHNDKDQSCNMTQSVDKDKPQSCEMKQSSDKGEMDQDCGTTQLPDKRENDHRRKMTPSRSNVKRKLSDDSEKLRKRARFQAVAFRVRERVKNFQKNGFIDIYNKGSHNVNVNNSKDGKGLSKDDNVNDKTLCSESELRHPGLNHISEDDFTFNEDDFDQQTSSLMNELCDTPSRDSQTEERDGEEEEEEEEAEEGEKEAQEEIRDEQVDEETDKEPGEEAKEGEAEERADQREEEEEGDDHRRDTSTLKKCTWKSVLFNECDDEMDEGHNLETPSDRHGARLIQIMEEDYKEYLVELDLMDIIWNVKRENINSKRMDRVVEQMKFGYRPTKGYIVVNIAKQDIPIELVKGEINKMTLSPSPTAHIIDGLYRICDLRTKHILRQLSSSRLIVCLVVRNDGKLLTKNERHTYAAGRRKLTLSAELDNTGMIIRRTVNICRFLCDRFEGAISRPKQWFLNEVKTIIGDKKSFRSSRSYVTIAMHCIEDEEKERRILSVVEQHEFIPLSFISNDYLLQQSSDVIELVLLSIARARDPRLKILYTEDNRSVRKRKDRRHSLRMIPASKKVLKYLVDDCFNLMNLLATLLTMFQVPWTGFLQKVFTTETDEQGKYIDGIADYVGETVFRQDEDDYVEVLKLIKELTIIRYKIKITNKHRLQLRKLNKEALELAKRTRDANNTREKKRKRTNTVENLESDEEYSDGTDMDDAESTDNGKKRKTVDSDYVNQDDEENDRGNIEEETEDDTVNNQQEEDENKVSYQVGQEDYSAKLQQEKNNIISQEEDDDTSNTQEGEGDDTVINHEGHEDDGVKPQHEKQDNVSRSKRKLDNRDKDDIANHKRGEGEAVAQDKENNTGPSEQEVEIVDVVNENSNGVEVNKGKEITETKLTICHGVQGICLNIQSNEQSGSTRINMDETNRRERGYMLNQSSGSTSLTINNEQENLVRNDVPEQDIDQANLIASNLPPRMPLIEPKLDADDIPAELPPGSLTKSEIISMNNRVKYRGRENLLKLDLPQSLWLIKDITAFSVAKWLRHMFIPSKHRINNLCTFETITTVHSQIFSLAAEKFVESSNSNNDFLLDSKNDEGVRRIVEAYGMSYFGLKQAEFRTNGWTILNGFCKDRNVHSLFGDRPNSLSFKDIEHFMKDMPLKDGENHLWERVCDSFQDDIVNLAGESYGRSITSTYAVTKYMEKNENEKLWKQRAILDMSIGMIVAILQIGSVKRGQPSLYMPNTGGRGLQTSPSTKRQDLHCDVEVDENERNQNRNQNPGVSVLISGKDGFPLWIAENSHIYIHRPKELRDKMRVKCRKVWVDPYSIITFRGDLCHAGGSGKDGLRDGNRRYHVPFIPVRCDGFQAVHFVEFGQVDFDM